MVRTVRGSEVQCKVWYRTVPIGGLRYGTVPLGEVRFRNKYLYYRYCRRVTFTDKYGTSPIGGVRYRTSMVPLL
jgi:hypothetical protein